ncbi:MAG: type II toxin-antitoxin system Y4mF family antitoxin [Kiritimatiellae bacterium]|nr:type II toxin-antitoxin system Y4mF family antitoxin [Kiritimatiellia bacterium]
MTVTEIGARIRAERKRQGVTQLELSQAADVGRRFVVELENGKETVQVGKMLKVLDILGIDFQLLDTKGF